MIRKGIILAGGAGTRLAPLTTVVSKQLLPVYDAPLIHYPLTTLLDAGIRDICIITTVASQSQFIDLLGDGSQYKAKFHYITQSKPRGIAEAYILAEEWLDGCSSALILGDNIFYGIKFKEQLKEIVEYDNLNSIFGQNVTNPTAYGVAELNIYGNLKSVIEKPVSPPSNWAIVGLYFFNKDAPRMARQLKPSHRNELEIADLINSYIKLQSDHVAIDLIKLDEGTIWFDTGKFDDLLEAGEFVRAIQKRTGIKVANLEKYRK